VLHLDGRQHSAAYDLHLLIFHSNGYIADVMLVDSVGKLAFELTASGRLLPAAKGSYE
jgi:hypothetical protein